MKVCITSTILFLCLSIGLLAQSPQIDSLKQAIETHTNNKDGVQKAKAMLELGRAYFNTNDYKNLLATLEPEIATLPAALDDDTKGRFILIVARGYTRKFQYERNFEAAITAGDFYAQTFPYFEKSKNDYRLAIAKSEYGLCLLIQQREDEAIPAFEKAVELFEKKGEINKDWVRALVNLSSTYSSQGDMETALKYVRQAKDIAPQLDDDKLLAELSISTGVKFSNLDKHDDALQNFNEALKLARKIDDPYLIGYSLMSSGSILVNSGDSNKWATGKKELEEAATIFTTIKDDYTLADINKYLAVYYANIKEYPKALKASSKYINFFQKKGDDEVIADGLILRGHYFNQANQTDSARIALLKGVELAKKVDTKRLLMLGYDYLADVEEKVGDFKQALAYHRQYDLYEDSIHTDDLNQVLGKESVTQNVEGAKQAQKEAELEAQVLASQNNLYLAIALGLLGILLIGGYLYQQLRKTRLQLEDQNVQLVQLNDTKDRFFGIIAHDIRSPITALESVGEQMTYYIEKNKPEKLKRLASRIDNTSKKLTNLLDNLLNWALIQKGMIPYNPKSLDVYDVVQENVELYHEVATLKNIQLLNNVAPETFVYADLSAVTTIVRNLINNAVKFTKKGGTVSVSTETKGDKVFITINDTGTGIGADRLKKLFSLNTQRNKGTAGEKGSGLGLILCKDLVELNKGTIQAVSELGRGSSFIFSLPLN